MIDLNKTMSYEEYLKGYTEEQASKQEKRYEQAVLDEAALKGVNNIKDAANVVVFSEGYCPDCHVVIPFVNKMADLNSNIKVHFMNRTGNEALLEQMTGEVRIPTVMFFTKDMEPKGVYIEFPEGLKEKMAGKAIEEIKAMVSDYRHGKYNELIQSEILNILTK